MQRSARKRAPSGDLASFEREVFNSDGFVHAVYRKGTGPAVLVLPELPGLTPQVLGFANSVAALGCTAVVPDLFGEAGRDPMAHGKLRAQLYGGRVMLQACVSREFTAFATGRSSPVVAWLRSLAEREHKRCGGPGIGAVGMCFTGGFALALASDPRVLAPVMSQPSLPLPIDAKRRRSIDCSEAELTRVAGRCANEGLRVLGLRFQGDRLAPHARFQFLKERLGDGFIAVELPDGSAHPDGFMKPPHCVLTDSLVDEPGEPTRNALDQVLSFLRERLIDVAARVSP